ncbi:hypothetical protein GCM10010358_34550 [Streptomyces minutiscleroticus]|uniref:Ppx/GppA phosphatase N-terminal domain-containing protein n=2 Tax=Streptomyces minutiscleroticus TaxID=68238 RepID=A0A918KWT3_9ACTN|nr:hypothetical protein GCM10010358_34550 [Streptomyces minutiscleroticus]
MGVLDVGSNTVRLVIAETDGSVPLPLHTAKRRLRLSRYVDRGGELPTEQVERLAAAVEDARREAARWGVRRPFAFATAIVRDAPNRQEVLREVEVRTGVPLHVLPGEVDAELTFLAARRWMGWRAGPMAMLDIGGGCFEVAFGRTRLPDLALSLPLGAGHLTREYFHDQDPPSQERIKALRRHVRHQLRDVAARIRWESPRTTVATSRVFQQLARLCGAAPGREGPFAPRAMTRSDLRRAVDRLAALPAAERSSLPGISPARAASSLAGAIVAHTSMKLMDIDEVTVCPWGLREGILLRCAEEGSTDWWDEAFPSAAPVAGPAPAPARTPSPAQPRLLHPVGPVGNHPLLS